MRRWYDPKGVFTLQRALLAQVSKTDVPSARVLGLRSGGGDVTLQPLSLRVVLGHAGEVDGSALPSASKPA